MRSGQRAGWFLGSGAASAVCGVLLALQHAGSPGAPRGAHAAGIGRPVRVGRLIYTAESVRQEPAGPACSLQATVDATCIVVRLARADATQVDASASVGRLLLRVGNGERFSPSGVRSLRCPRDACDTLEPGESRVDELVYVSPGRSNRAMALEIEAAPDEPGPRSEAITF